jgi:hypothetical protein
MDGEDPIDPDCDWNMDEKGIQNGGGRKNNQQKVMLSRHSRKRYKTTNSDLELTTVIECVSAAGVAMPPGFVFQGKRLRKEWFEGSGVGQGW